MLRKIDLAKNDASFTLKLLPGVSVRPFPEGGGKYIWNL